MTSHIQAIANTAAFHFAFIEQGGSSLYAAMAQKATNLEVLRIIVSIGPTETAHFQTWHDKAGNAPAVTDGALVFPDLEAGPFESDELFKKNLIMPEPCEFLSPSLPRCSIVRPTATAHAAMNAVVALARDGLFIGQSQEFFQTLRSSRRSKTGGSVPEDAFREDEIRIPLTKEEAVVQREGKGCRRSEGRQAPGDGTPKHLRNRSEGRGEGRSRRYTS